MRRKEQPTKTTRANFADHIKTLQNMTQSNDLVHQVNITKDKVPSVILYTSDQIDDITRFCCSAPPRTTVLGFDKTFNLGDLHINVAILKNLSVRRRDNNQHPIFIGPIFLNGNSDFLSYHSFFVHLSARLRGTSHPFFGTDDEMAMKLAI